MITQASCKFTSSLLAYFDKMGHSTPPLFEVFDYPEEFLRDSHGWLDISDGEKFFEKAAKITRDPMIARTVGLMTYELGAWGALDNVFKMMGEETKYYYAKLDRFFSYFLAPLPFFVEIARTPESVTFRNPLDPAVYPYLSEFLLATLEILPKFTGKMPAQIQKSSSSVTVSWQTFQTSFFTEEDNNLVMNPKIINQMTKQLEASERKIEELKLINQKLQSQIKDQVSEQIYSEKMKSLAILASGVAHEINNPLSYVMSNLGRFKEYLDNIQNFTLQAVDQSELSQSLRKHFDIEYIFKETPEMLEQSLQGLLRVKEIVKDLSVLAHPEQERLESKSNTNLNQLLESSMKVFSDSIKERIKVSKDFQLDEGVEIYPVRMSQVFTNLLSNAIHAIDDKGVIEIKTWKDTQNVFVEISDSGHGMDEATMGKIFTPFFTTKSVGTGTGLGLSIAQSIVEMHRGHITVKSAEGGGSSFIIQLPRGELNA